VQGQASAATGCGINVSGFTAYGKNMVGSVSFDYDSAVSFEARYLAARGPDVLIVKAGQSTAVADEADGFVEESKLQVLDESYDCRSDASGPCALAI